MTPVDLRRTRALEAATAAGHAKMDTVLYDLARIYRRGGIDVADVYAAAHQIDLRQDAVLVRVDTGWPVTDMRLEEASSRAVVEDVLTRLEGTGGIVRNLWGPYVEAWVPLATLEELSSHETVRGIRKVWRAVPDVTSEGLTVIGADRWEGLLFRSPDGGLKVGVIDTGFEGYRDLRGRDLPPEERIQTNSFRDDDDIEAEEDHGTAVAEIIYDMVPEVELYLTNIETAGDLAEAMTWLINEGVHVINMSLGFFNGGPGDGTGPIVDTVENAPQRDIPFVTSAGNQAGRHWIGPFVDSDGDAYHEFAPGDETNSFEAEAGDEIDIFMTWDFSDWYSSSQDFDLLLLNDEGNVVDQSRVRQSGGAGQYAAEEISLIAPFAGTYHIVVERRIATLPETFEIHVWFNGLEYVNPEQSLTVPADGASVFAVGAAFFGNGALQAYSSHGPTKDGRIKPDLVAPVGVSTATFGPTNFFGTSAASPHAAGAVALFVGRLGLGDPMLTLEMLRARARDMGEAGPDNLTGYGLLSVLPQ